MNILPEPAEDKRVGITQTTDQIARLFPDENLRFQKRRRIVSRDCAVELIRRILPNKFPTDCEFAALAFSPTAM